MGHADPVTPIMREAVFARDRAIVARVLADEGIATEWRRERLMAGGAVFCPAVVIDPDEWGNCAGRWRVEHVKDRPRLGIRARSDMAHLMALCAAHTEDGMKAGRIWATQTRKEQREYLAQANK